MKAAIQIHEQNEKLIRRKRKERNEETRIRQKILLFHLYPPPSIESNRFRTFTESVSSPPPIFRVLTFLKLFDCLPRSSHQQSLRLYRFLERVRVSLSAIVVRGEVLVVGGRFEAVRVVVRRYLSILTGGVRVRAVRVGRNCRGVRLERNAVRRSVVCGRCEVRSMSAK
jgi:hypothetical protein